MSDRGARFDRRTFGLGLLGGLLGCATPPPPPPPPARPRPRAVVRPPGPSRLPLIELQGTPFELGQGIGRQAAPAIRAMLAERAGWWKELLAFVAARPAALLDRFQAAARAQAPDALEELRGLADGSKLPFRELLILNLQAELDGLRAQEAGGQAAAGSERSPGCSTILLRTGQRGLLAHNEDGDRANLDRMLLLRLRPTGKPAVLAACYPGLLPGNAPWLNERGLVMTCNFIASPKVKVGGVGRLFVHRQTMQATDLEQAVRLATHPQRAYSYHCLLASAPERRAISVEVTADRVSREEAAGLFLHTNHLVHESLAGEAQDVDYVGTSSATRWNVLRDWKASVDDIDTLVGDDLISVLCSHQGRPYSPCRHPEGEVRGATLLAVLVDLPARRLRLYKGQPCLARFEDLSF